ncbi:ABC transporter permease [Parageobacillus sp. VR-IP]|uniref:ABC transporter permease n=1 Tax=Parageobacillus sp. VR-IP TaxID=2742205 RepID=UPI002738539F|nr:ABC transporter permease [Parageobacillus sp. VR-IP]
MNGNSMIGSQERAVIKNKQSKKAVFEKMYALLGLVLLSVTLTILSPYFLTIDNLLSIALQTAIIAILALGQVYVIISGGIDLSVGSILALSGVISAQLLVSGWPTALAIVAGILAGALLGFINGLVITKGNLPPFIVTLGMMGVARGLSLVLTDGLPVSGLPETFTKLGNETIFYIPIPVIFLIVVAIISSFILSRTIFGRYVYSIGSNEEAAQLSGINVNFHKLMIYVVCGLLSGLAGVLLTARLVSAQPSAGTGYELDAIAAGVIGGASLMGGVGTVGGTIIGAFIMGVLRNGLDLLNVTPFWQQIAIGVVIVLAVYLDQMRRK